MFLRALTGALLLALAASSALAQSGTSTAAKSANIGAILAKAADRGEAEAIVEFALPEPEIAASVAPDADPAAQAAADGAKARTVREMQDRILLDTFGSTASVPAAGDAEGGRSAGKGRHIARMKFAPRFTFIGSLSDLEQLARHPSVTRIYPIEEYPLNLDSALAAVGMATAHGVGWKGENTYIAILDSGVERNHVFFGGPDASRVVFEACFSNSNRAGENALCPNGTGFQDKAGAAAPNCAKTPNQCDHGTHVAGIAAGGRTSGTPLTGAAPEAKIIAVQVGTKTLDKDKKPVWTARNDDLERAIEYVGEVQTKLVKGKTLAAVNMSLGGGRLTAACGDDALAAPIRTLSLRTAIVIAAGNNGYRDAVASPGCIAEAVTVSASTDTDEIADFSNIDDTTDLVAPGVDIVSSVTGNGFASLQGTSMASPLVAGTIAVIREAMASDQTMTSSKVVAKLKETGVAVRDRRPAQDVPSRPAGTLTKPRIDVAAALDALGAPKITLKFFNGTKAVNVLRGKEGGPFAPAKLEVQAFATRGNHLYELTGVPNWLRVSPTPLKGYVSSTGSKFFTLVPNEVANRLNPGQYTAQIRFATSTALSTQAMTVMLVVAEPPPPGDAFEAPRGLNFSNGVSTRTGNSAAATLQAGEPRTGAALQHSIWFKLDAEETGVARVDTAGSTFATALGLYRGSTLASLSLLAAHGNVLTFDITKGQTYYVQLGSATATAGDYKLVARFAPRGVTVSPKTSIYAEGTRGSTAVTRNLPGYTIANPGLGEEDVQVQDLPEWLTAVPARFTLAAGASREVKINFTAAVANFWGGTRTASIIFRDMRTGKIAATRVVQLRTTDPTDRLIVSPETNFVASGRSGSGSFTSNIPGYTISNPQNPAAFMVVENLPNWLSATTGLVVVDIPAGGTAELPLAVINSVANALPAGTYTRQITFFDFKRKERVRRTVSLEITESGGTDALYIDDRSLDSTGPVGGPFSPQNVSIALYNVGTDPIEWSYSLTGPIADVLTTSHVAGQTYTIVPENGYVYTYFNIDTRANSLAPGVYSGTLTFLNKNSGRTFDRSLKLTVAGAGGSAQLSMGE